jgi:hypothetical protein
MVYTSELLRFLTFQSPGFLKTRKRFGNLVCSYVRFEAFTAVTMKNGLFLSSGEGRKTPILWGPLERANLNHPTQYVSSSLHLRTESRF